MNLEREKQKHEEAIEIIEFLQFLERHEELTDRSNVNYKKTFGKDLSDYDWNMKVIKRARNYSLNRLERL